MKSSLKQTKSTPKTTTITISLPGEMSKAIQKLAKEEHRTVSELIREAVRRYNAQAILQRAVTEGRALVKKKGLKPEDFGGPFEE